MCYKHKSNWNTTRKSRATVAKLMSKKEKLTHGEAVFLIRNNFSIKDDFSKISTYIQNIPKRMGREDALSYYGAKFKKYFGTDEVTLRDFDSGGYESEMV